MLVLSTKQRVESHFDLELRAAVMSDPMNTMSEGLKQVNRTLSIQKTVAPSKCIKIQNAFDADK